MIEKTVKTMDGKLSISLPSSVDEITLGQLMEMQDRPALNDLDAISILAGIPLNKIQNVRNFEDLYVFGEVVSLLSNQLKNLYANEKIPKRVTFYFGGSHKTVKVMHNLSVEPAGAFFAAREIITEEINEHIKNHGDQNWQSTFTPSLKACCQVLAHYFYCRVTGKLYDEYEAEEFSNKVKKLGVMEALPIARHFFMNYPALSTRRPKCLGLLLQRWKKRRASALLKSLHISIP